MTPPTACVLVVDDDQEVRRFLSRLLVAEGYSVQLAEDGEAALAAIAAHEPDLVSLDLVMPRLDGWGVLERLKDMADPPPIILLTGIGYEGNERSLSPVVVGIVHKADEPRLFLETCRRVLEGLPTDDSSRPGAERRRARRRPLIVPVHISTTGGMVLGEGKLVRLSPIGADLESGAALPPGGTVRLAVPLPGRDEPLLLSGELHSRGETDKGYLFGVSFVNAAPDVRALLERLLAD
jgi:CheY-like chemotaxis protein